MFLGAADTGEGWHFPGPGNLLFDQIRLEGKESRKPSMICRTSREPSAWKRKDSGPVFSTPDSYESRQAICLPLNPKFHRFLPLMNLCFRPHGEGTGALLSKSPDFIYGTVSHGFIQLSGPFVVSISCKGPWEWWLLGNLTSTPQTVLDTDYWSFHRP